MKLAVIRKKINRQRLFIIALLLVFPILLFLSLLSVASEQSYIPLGLEQGVSQATINTVAQDNTGYIWIGTQDGLNRYDGYRIIQFHHRPNDPGSLSHSFINKVIVDKNNDVWVLTAAGIDRFDRKTESFIRYVDQSFNDEFFDRLFLWSMRDGKNNNLWITTADGLLELNKVTGKYQHYPSGSEFGLTAKNTYDLRADASGVKIIASDNGVFAQTVGKSTFQQIPLRHLEPSEKEPRVYCISNQLSGIYFLCSRNGIYYYYQNKFHFVPNEKMGLGAQSTKILITKNHELWIGTVSGLYVKKIDINHLEQSLKANESVTLKDNTITTLFQDRDDVIWVGTNVSALFKILPTARAFSHYSASTQSQARIANNLITVIVQSSSGEVWVGDSRGGISIISKDNSVRRLFLFDQHGQKVFHTILDIEFDLLGNTWVTNALGVARLGANGKQREILTLSDPTLTQQTYATQLVRSSDGRLWATGLESGLNLFDVNQNAFVPVRPINWPKDKPFAKLIYTAIFDNNVMWLGGYQGILYRYDLYTRTASQYVMADPENPNLAVTQIYGLTKDNQGNLWISGMGGIGKFNLKKRLFQYLSNQSSLPSKTYYSVSKDKEGFIWSTPANQLIRINPFDNSVLTFNRSTGMPIIEFSPAVLKDNQELLWLGGLNGLTVFDPLSLVAPKSEVVPVLNQVQRKQVLKSSPQESVWKSLGGDLKETVIIPPSETTLKYNFSILDFSQNSSVRYRYRLDGFEKSWNIAELGNPHAIYTNLSHGDYRLLVATSFDGVNWSKPTVLAETRILPYFWQTLWFKLVIILVFFIAIYLAFKLIVLRNKIRSEKLEDIIVNRTTEISKLLAERTRFFAFVSHELKTPLTLIHDPLFRLRQSNIHFDKDSKEHLSTAVRNVGKLSNMVERLLSYGEDDILHRREVVKVDDRIIESISQLSEFAARKHVTIVVRKLESCYLMANICDIEIIIYNLLNNAIKYNREGGQVIVSCYHYAQKLIISVADEGIGFNNATEKTKTVDERSISIKGGYGLSLVRQSISLLRGTLRIKTAKNVGSVACVFLPFDQECFSESKDDQNSNVDQQYSIKSNLNLKQAKKLPNLTKVSKNDELPILMIVEDNRELRDYLHSIFQNRYHCVTFTKAESAFKQAVEIIPDMIISDVMLPGMSGIEFCKNIKAEQTTCHIPLLLLTARSDQASIISGLQHQATDYLTKPFNSEELKIRVANLVKRFEQNYQSNQRVSISNRFIDESDTPEGLSEKDVVFMRRFVEVLELNYAESDYNLDLLSSDLYMSKKQLSRKLKAICQKSPMEYLKEYRLERSLNLLSQGKVLSEVAIESGFSSQSYFSTCFKNHFQQTPKQFQVSVNDHRRQSSASV